MRDTIVFLLGLSFGLLISGFLIPVPGYSFHPIKTKAEYNFSSLTSYTVYLYRWELKEK